MCYDMSFFSNLKHISTCLQIPLEPLEFHPTYHAVAQAYPKWPVAINEHGLKIKLFEWGLIADYMNTSEKIKQYRSSMANARSEKIIDDKKSIWHRLRNNRCLVFTTGFFEHRDIGTKKKLPYFIKIKNQEIFCFAGLYNYSPIPNMETGEMVGTFTIITQPANALMKKIHNAGPNGERMPLILTQSLALQWLKASLTDEQISETLNFEFPDNEMEAWPVRTIRTKKIDDETVVTPLQGDYPAL